MTNLAGLMASRGELGEAEQWYRKAAEAGEPAGMQEAVRAGDRVLSSGFWTGLQYRWSGLEVSTHEVGEAEEAPETPQTEQTPETPQTD
jgi:TPR repeat protein